MAINRRKRHQRWRRLRKPKDDPEKTRFYTTQDEKALITKRDNGAGILRSSSNNFRVSNRLGEVGEGDQTAHSHHVLLVIVLLAFTFIAIVAYFVARMPVKQ